MILIGQVIKKALLIEVTLLEVTKISNFNNTIKFPSFQSKKADLGIVQLLRRERYHFSFNSIKSEIEK